MSSFRKITSSFHDIALADRGKHVPHISSLLDRAPSSIYEMLNPYQQEGRQAKLGIEEAFAISDYLSDYAPIIKALEERGFHVSKSDMARPVLTVESAYRELAEVCSGVGRLADTIHGALKNTGEFNKADMVAIFEAATSLHEELHDVLAGAQKAARQ